MLHTPDAFTPLIDAPEPAPAAADTLTFVFHRGRLLLRTPELALPTAAEVAALDIDLGRAQPVGLWQGRYCQTVWRDEESLPADSGLAWYGLRSLFNAVDDGFLAWPAVPCSWPNGRARTVIAACAPRPCSARAASAVSPAPPAACSRIRASRRP